MKILLQIGRNFLVMVCFVFMSPFILYGIVQVIWNIYCTIEDFMEDTAIAWAASSIEQFQVDNQHYDIATIVFGISNSEIEYRYDGTQFVIENLAYKMGSGVFDHKCTQFLRSHDKDSNDKQLINDICHVLNQYDLDYQYIDPYDYRGFLYGDTYVFGQYSESYLNGQYLEISLRPIQGPNTILRFDLELSSDSLEYDIINDLKAIDNVKNESLVTSVHNLLGLINTVEHENLS
ncbi:MAG: hypothetical protein R3Y63_02320 [Eubacteriales bacterium]